MTARVVPSQEESTEMPLITVGRLLIWGTLKCSAWKSCQWGSLNGRYGKGHFKPQTHVAASVGEIDHATGKYRQSTREMKRKKTHT